MSDEEEYCIVTFTCTLDDTPVEDALIILSRTEENLDESIPREYKLHTNSKGVVKKRVLYGEYNLHSEYIDNQYHSYDSPNILFLKTEEEQIHIKLYRCENEVLLNKSCKYFHHDPYMTPNNYDLYFDYTKIPVNNIIESPYDLRKRLQRKLPLTKLLHLNLETQEAPQRNTIHLYSSVKLSYNSFNSDKCIHHIYCEWNDLLLEEMLLESWEEYNEGLDTDSQISLEEYKEQVSLDDFKEDVTVYMVRVKSEEDTVDYEPQIYELTKTNNWETYTDPMDYYNEKGNVIKYEFNYNKTLPVTIGSKQVTDDFTRETIQLL